MSKVADNQVAVLLDLAWHRCGITFDELLDYNIQFRTMTAQQATDLIVAWQDLPITRTDVRPPAFKAAPADPQSTGQVAAVTAVAQIDAVNARLIIAKYNTICSVCHIPIAVGQEIWYAKGYVANHRGCGVPYVKSGTPITANVTQTPPPTVPTPPTYYCNICNTPFATPAMRDSHTTRYHPVRQHVAGWSGTETPPVKPTLPPIAIPEKGYFAVEVPVYGVATMRFYRVTERNGKTPWGRPNPLLKIKVFLRQSGDNWVDIDPTEAMIAAAIINAAPILAKEAYGKLIGSCGNCGRTLTDPDSRAIGIGPECKKHFPGRYQ